MRRAQTRDLPRPKRAPVIMSKPLLPAPGTLDNARDAAVLVKLRHRTRLTDAVEEVGLIQPYRADDERTPRGLVEEQDVFQRGERIGRMNAGRRTRLARALAAAQGRTGALAQERTGAAHALAR